jgi:hypothetical protein
MRMPTVPHTFRAPKRNITLTLLAYRQLSDQEARQAAAFFFSHHRTRRNSHYTVITLIGCDDPIGPEGGQPAR